MDYLTLQTQYDKIYSYFRTTTEPLDSLKWDGRVLRVWYKNSIVEIYRHADLTKLIEGF